MNKKQIKIDVIFDIVCPWCIIGYRRLQGAIEKLSDTCEFNIHWHPFELNPSMPEGGENLRTHLANKYGTTLEDSIRARENITKIGAGLDFSFNYFDEMKMFNTFKAHMLIRYAREKQKEELMILRLFSAFFGEKQEIDQDDVLVEQATLIGLDAIEVRSVINSTNYADLVKSEEKEWLSRGISSVPTYIFNDQYALSGAHDTDNLVDFILSLK